MFLFTNLWHCGPRSGAGVRRKKAGKKVGKKRLMNGLRAGMQVQTMARLDSIVLHKKPVLIDGHRIYGR